jgi:glycosyltransferase involved in cell wall biosynthesis
MNDLISVVIPLYNHASELAKSLTSLDNQTHKNLEVIIVNDGSKDNFKKVITDLHLNWKIKIIDQANHGAAAARNRGLQAATGEFIIFWDADTVANKNMLASMLFVLKKNTRVSYVYSAFKLGWKKFGSYAFNVVKLKQNNYIDTVSLVRKRDLPSGGWDENLSRFQDWDLWLTMLENNKRGELIPKVLYKKLVGKRKGISRWLPSFIYLLKNNAQVNEYNRAKEIVLKKHGLAS